jgi:hypothetical protein
MFGRRDTPNVRIGTTAPVLVPRDQASPAIAPGEYFWINVAAAQVAYRGSVFEQVKQLVVTSQINLNHPLLGDDNVYAVQRVREVQKGVSEELGLTPNLVSLVPATMTHVSLSIDFLLDKENNLARLGGIVNDNSLLAVVSLAPGAAAVAKAVGGLAQKLIQTFIPLEQQQPILQFAGDFNIGASLLGGDAGSSALRSGCYAILGTVDPQNPLPDPLPALEMRQGQLYAGGQAVNNLSYIVLDVTRVPARTRLAAQGAPWDAKLREAESLVQEAADSPYQSDDDKREVWRKCLALLQEARALLLADTNYAPQEAQDIYKTVYKECADIIKGAGAGTAIAKGEAPVVDTKTDRLQMGIAPAEDLDQVVDDYSARAAEAARIMSAASILNPADGGDGQQKARMP